MISLDRTKCIGCGNCVSLCPDSFEISEDGKVNVKEGGAKKLDCVKDAVEACPVQCIKIIK